MSKYVYFTDAEVEGLLPDICFKLDRARELFGSPLVITSGYRDPNHNDSVGGVKDSAHTSGKAVDIRLSADPFMQKKLAWALGRSGFDRVIFYTRHVHVDVDKEKPFPICIDGGESH